jgi:hypothetical protein
MVKKPAGLKTRPAWSSWVPGNRFSPTPWGGYCMPLAGSSSAASTKTVPAVPAETAYEDRPLTTSALLPKPVLGGEPCGGCLCPWFHGQTSNATTLYSNTVVHCVQSWYISRYVYSNKLVLVYKVVAMLVWPRTRGVGSLHTVFNGITCSTVIQYTIYITVARQC